MSAAPSPDESVGAVRGRRRIGAVRGRRHRRGGGWWWWLLGALAVLLVAAGVIALVRHYSGGSSHSTASGHSALIGGGGHRAVKTSGKEATGATAGVVLFAESSAAIDHQARTVIVSAADQLRRAHAHHVVVTGYTDIVAGKHPNRALSRRRAVNVAHILRHELGKHVTIAIRARGQTHPLTTNHTAKGRALNRRVTITRAHASS